MRTLTLFVPSLFWPDPDNANAHAGMNVPALEALISRGDAADAECADETAWLCDRFGVKRQLDWPSAPLALYGAEIDPGAACWFHADPVHLDVRRDRLTLLLPEPGSIADAEARSLTQSLNLHFGADGLQFVAAASGRWFIKVESVPKLRTTALSRVIGRHVEPLLPQGEDRLAWHRLANEVQMLLHAHPVNAAREQLGLPPINGLWFWGGGTLPEVRPPFDAVFGVGDLLRGLCRRVRLPWAGAADGPGSLGGDNILVELDCASQAARHGDLCAWRNALHSLEANWFAPLSGSLRACRLSALTVATVAHGRRREWTVGPLSLWKFWKPRQCLAAVARDPDRTR